jgi:hypothetical protein
VSHLRGGALRRVWSGLHDAVPPGGGEGSDREEPRPGVEDEGGVVSGDCWVGARYADAAPAHSPDDEPLAVVEG